MTDFHDWIGKTMVADDEITAAPLRALSATLGRDDPSQQTGTPLPPLWHWLFFWPLHRPDQLRHDGHAKGGEFMPPIPLPRRMWAGSRFVWDNQNPLRVGDKITRISRIDSIVPKTGRSGQLVFVKTIHEFHNQRGLAFTNEHDSAFREAARQTDSPAEPVRAELGAPWQREITPDPILLFRYAALTFNAHRIHYDAPYATQSERYPALLVQGPLIATLLVDLLRRQAPDANLRQLELKAVRPTYEGRPMRVNGKPEGHRIALWAEDHEGYLTMKASAEID